MSRTMHRWQWMAPEQEQATAQASPVKGQLYRKSTPWPCLSLSYCDCLSHYFRPTEFVETARVVCERILQELIDAEARGDRCCVARALRDAHDTRAGRHAGRPPLAEDPGTARDMAALVPREISRVEFT